MNFLVQEAVTIALLLIAPLLVGLLLAGAINTVIGSWVGAMDPSLSNGLRWLCVSAGLVVAFKLGTPRMIAFARETMAYAGASASPSTP